MLVNLHNGSLITTSIAIVGCRKYRHHIPILTPIVAFHNKLMSSCNERKSIVMVECLADILAEGVSCTTRGDSPPASVVWIAPQQIAHWPLMRDFLYPVKRADVIEGVD